MCNTCTPDTKICPIIHQELKKLIEEYDKFKIEIFKGEKVKLLSRPLPDKICENECSIV